MQKSCKLRLTISIVAKQSDIGICKLVHFYGWVKSFHFGGLVSFWENFTGVCLAMTHHKYALLSQEFVGYSET